MNSLLTSFKKYPKVDDDSKSIMNIHPDDLDEAYKRIGYHYRACSLNSTSKFSKDLSSSGMLSNFYDYTNSTGSLSFYHPSNHNLSKYNYNQQNYPYLYEYCTGSLNYNSNYGFNYLLDKKDDNVPYSQKYKHVLASPVTSKYCMGTCRKKPFLKDWLGLIIGTILLSGFVFGIFYVCHGLTTRDWALKKSPKKHTGNKIPRVPPTVSYPKKKNTSSSKNIGNPHVPKKKHNKGT